MHFRGKLCTYLIEIFRYFKLYCEQNRLKIWGKIRTVSPVNSAFIERNMATSKGSYSVFPHRGSAAVQDSNSWDLELSIWRREKAAPVFPVQGEPKTGLGFFSWFSTAAVALVEASNYLSTNWDERPFPPSFILPIAPCLLFDSSDYLLTILINPHFPPLPIHPRLPGPARRPDCCNGLLDSGLLYPSAHLNPLRSFTWRHEARLSRRPPLLPPRSSGDAWWAREINQISSRKCDACFGSVNCPSLSATPGDSVPFVSKSKTNLLRAC